MSEFTEEMLKELKKNLNKCYKERAKIIKKLTTEYKKNTILIYNEIIKARIKKTIENIREFSCLSDNLSITEYIQYKNINEIFNEERNRLAKNGLILIEEEWDNLKEKDIYARTTIEFSSNEEKESFEFYGTETSTNGLDVSVCFDKILLKQLVEKDDLKFVDCGNGTIAASINIPSLEYLLTPKHSKENQKLKIYTKDKNH